jgi:3-phenylpropionate/cinnamic acid dioxygenase small subunit
MNERPPSIDFAFYRQILDFLHEEARLLDDGKLAQWLDLYAEDGVYWIPSRHGQTDTRGVPSIIYEDRPLLAMRVQRLGHPRAYAALPAPRTMHLVGNVDVVGHDEAADEWRVSSKLLAVEHQADRTRIFAGHGEHVLRRRGGAFKIVFKRIDLIDCEGVHDKPMTILL